MGGSWTAMVDLLGEEAAAKAVHRSPSVLMTRSSTIRGAFGVLTELFGAVEALQLVEQSIHVLCARPSTIRKCWDALENHLGTRIAREQVLERPRLLHGLSVVKQMLPR